MKFILGTKLGMTQIFREDGVVMPVTRVKAGPCVITQVKIKKKDGINAVQVGFGLQKKFRMKKAQQGHLKDLATVRFMRDFKVIEEHELKRGDEYTVKVFEPGEKIQVIGRSKGKGFQGVVKRHGFHGSPASHGHKDQLRMPGSIGATDAARVFKGTRMAGRTGNDQVTVKNLEIVEIRPEDNELLIKGAVPGARGGLLFISTDVGKMEITTINEQPTTNNEQAETDEEEEKEKTQTDDSESQATVDETDGEKKKDTEEVHNVETQNVAQKNKENNNDSDSEQKNDD